MAKILDIDIHLAYIVIARGRVGYAIVLQKRRTDMKARMKRTKAQRDADRELIADLVLHHHLFQAEIARSLNERKDIKYKLSQQMISFDLRQIQKKWIRETMKILDAYKAEQLKKIDQIESELWAAWYRSCSERQRERGERSTVGGAYYRK